MLVKIILFASFDRTPGYCATDLNNNSGPRTSRVGARSIVYALTIPLSESGGFWIDNKPIPIATQQPSMKEIVEASAEENKREDERWIKENIA